MPTVTDIATEKNPALDLILADNYYKEFPSHILGTVTTRKGRFGKIETEVRSDQTVRGTANQIMKLAGIPLQSTPIPQPWFTGEDVSKFLEQGRRESQLMQNIREAIAKAKEQQRNPPEKKSERHNIIPFNEVQEKWGAKVSDEEKQVWTWYQTGKLFAASVINNPANGWQQFTIPAEEQAEKIKEWTDKGLLCYDGVEYFPANVFFAGNIYARLDALDTNKEKIIATIGEENYQRQLDKMEASVPALLRLDAPAGERLYISPLDPFCKNNYVAQLADGTVFDEPLNLIDAFESWMQGLPKQDFKEGSNATEIINYWINHERFATRRARNAEEKEKQKLEKIETKRRSQVDGMNLFARFLFEAITKDDQKEFSHKWNREFNAFREYNFDHIPVGFAMSRYFNNSPIDPRKALWDGVKFLTMNGSGIVAFDVGVGKTMTAILAVAQALYTGQCKRPLIVVPNPTYKKWIKETVGEFAEDGTVKFHGVLPQYKDRINDLYNLGAGYREKLPERVPTDYTITFITYEGLEQLGFGDKARNQIGDELFRILNQGLTDRDKEKLREGVDKILGDVNANTVANFDELGFDYIVVDEAHNFKNIFTRVKPRVEEGGHYSGDDEEESTGGRDPQRGNTQYEISGGEPSQRGMKLFAAAQYVLRNNAMRNVVLLTATPFTNSPLEVYSMLSLVAYQHLEKRGINSLVDFFDKFINMENEAVVTTRGKFEFRSVIKSFNNRQVLQAIIFSSIIYKTGEEANVLRPKKIVYPYLKDENGIFLPEKDRVETSLIPTKDQAYWLKEIAKFANDKRDSNGNAITPYVPSKFWVKVGFGPARLLGRDLIAIALGKACTLSPYLMKVGDNLIFQTEEPDYKTFIESSPKLKYVCGCIKTVREWHIKRNEPVSGQVIYMNMATEYFPKIKEYLVKEIGYAEAEVQIISGGVTPKKKEKIKDDFQEGRVKIIIGSATIKEGIDLQNRSTCLYICNLDWNPTDQKQIEGRIHRQNNIHSYVRIVTPMIENSLDVLMFQKLEEKTARINDIWYRQGRGNVLNIEQFDPKELKIGLMTDPAERVEFDIDREKIKLKARKEVCESAIKQLKEAQEAIEQVRNDSEEIAETYKTALAQQKQQLQEWQLKLTDEKISKTDRAYYMERERVLRELLEKQETEKTRIAICKRYANSIITNDEISSWDKREAGRIAEHMDEALTRLKLLDGVEKNLLAPRGLSLTDDLEPEITRQAAEVVKIDAENDRISSDEYKQAEIKRYEAEAKARNLLSKPVFERVKEFTKYNHLLSCLEKVHECSMESKEIKKKAAPTEAKVLKMPEKPLENYRLSNVSYRLKEELEYEQNNLKQLLAWENPSAVILRDIEQTKHTIKRIEERLVKQKGTSKHLTRTENVQPGAANEAVFKEKAVKEPFFRETDILKPLPGDAGEAKAKRIRIAKAKAIALRLRYLVEPEKIAA